MGGALESEFVLRFQQLCAPAMAKGIEDTAFYTYNRFVALNEVGGDPSRFGITPKEFHEAMLALRSRHPQTMLATDTHDAKRGEDARARLSVLSQLPDEWIAAVREWSVLNEPRRQGGAWPDRNTEYLLYQTLVGAWPIETPRVVAYMEKAVREAKAHTSWTGPVPAYEAALRGFIEAILGDAGFVERVGRFVESITEPGRVVSLAQTLLKVTAPGIPDVYQGADLWAHALVDPDNRRPVDFARRRELLAAACAAAPEDVLARADEGLPKLWLLQRALRVRAEQPEAFGPSGAYRPLEASGPGADRLVAFVRGDDVIAVIPRLSYRFSWGDATLDLPAGRWCNELTSEEHSGDVRVHDLLHRFPVALLTRSRD